MFVKFILPALTEATSPLFRPIKYSLFPPLGLATLAAYLDAANHAEIADEHVRPFRLDDRPDLVVIQVYITSARRSYEIADSYRRRSLPEEAAGHVDVIFTGPGEDTWPRFLRDYRAGTSAPRYDSTVRTLRGRPPIRRDLIQRHLYLVPNSIVVTRGCPHVCDFCYKEAFFAGGRGFYTQPVDDALAEIDRLPGRHLYFLDDHLFGYRRVAASLFEGMRGMGRIWQGAGTVNSLSESTTEPRLLEKAAASGLRSLFVGFEGTNQEAWRSQRKFQNLNRDYSEAIRRLHGLGIMVQRKLCLRYGSRRPRCFERTVEWVFHILTPYPGTPLYQRMQEQGRLLHSNWDLYDTRHTVFRPARISPEALEEGYWRAYRDFYRWGAIERGALAKESWAAGARHFAYAAGWKKFEPFWDLVLRVQTVSLACEGCWNACF